MNRNCIKGGSATRSGVSLTWIFFFFFFNLLSVTNEIFLVFSYYWYPWLHISHICSLHVELPTEAYRPANLGVRWQRGTSRTRVPEYAVVHCELSARVVSARSSIVRPRVPDRRDHVRGRRVFRASLLHVVHQRAVLALVRVEIRLLTACHATTVPGIYLLQMIQRLA